MAVNGGVSVAGERAAPLWGAGEGQDRSRLTLSGIVAVAVELADAEGLAALSMRRVAERLGFTGMSLYRHVPGKAQLVELMRDEVFGELTAAGPEPAGGAASEAAGGWRDELETWARAAWSLHLRHLWLVRTGGSRRLPGPNAVAWYDRGLAIAERTGLPATEAVAVISLVTGFVETAARQAEEILRQQNDSGVSQEQWWRGHGELFERLRPYPAMGRLWRAGGFDEFEDPFDFGLARTLDGVALLVQRRCDESRDVNPTAVWRCSVCGTPLDGATRGRPREYCSRACRQRAYRQRRPLPGAGPASPESLQPTPDVPARRRMGPGT